MRKNKTFNRIVSLGLVVGILASIGIGAYLTSTDVKQDVYTVGNVQAEIVSNGDMELNNVGALLPGTVHQYERAAMNTGINDAYVFMSLTIPYEMVGVSEDDGTQIGERVRQLFTPGVDGGFIGSEWKLVDVGYIGQYEIEDNGQYCGEHDQYSAVVGDTITYVYGYIGDNADGSLKALASGETTSNLVETMELTNLYHADKIDGEISTKLYAIQSNNVNGGLTDVNGVWAVINKALVGAENDATATLTYSLTNTRTGDAVGYAPLKLVDENGNVVATSVANESGNGQFQNVPAGDYAIETAVGDLAVSGATGYAMRRVAANVTISTDSYVDLAFTAPSTTLITGNEFNALIPIETTSLVFTTGAAGAGAFDVSEGKDGSVMAWIEGTTMYVSAVDGGLIYANADSDFMLRNKSNLTNLDLANIDFSGVYHGQHIFNGCGDVSASLKDIDLSNMYIGAGLFYNCSWLTEYTIPEGLGIIDKYMFYKTSISSIVIPSSVESIGHNAFGQCQNLTSVVIEDGATYIDSSAFANCRTLTSVTIPASVTEIGDSAFANCTSLASINYLGTQEQWNAIKFGTNWNRNTAMNPAHKCESVCPDCEGCLDVDCKESACLAKCKCGVVETGNATFSITDNLTANQTGGQQFSHYLVSLATFDGKDYYCKYTVTVNLGTPVILDKIVPGTYYVLVNPMIAEGQYWTSMDTSLQDIKTITIVAGETKACHVTLGEVVAQNGYVNLSVTDYNTWGQTVSAYEFVIDGKTYTVNPGKTSRVTLPVGTYKDVVVYAVFADGSKSTSIQDKNTFTIQADKTVTFKVAFGEIPNFDWTIGVYDFLTWDDKKVDYYEISIDNGKEIVTVSPIEGSPSSEVKTISVKAGSHPVSVTVYFTDGTSVKAQQYQNGTSYNISKDDMWSTIKLGYKANISVVDNYAWETAPTSYKVSVINGQTITITPGKTGMVQLAPGTHDVVVYAVMADKSEVQLSADVVSITVDKTGSTYTITVNGPVDAE